LAEQTLPSTTSDCLFSLKDEWMDVGRTDIT